MPKKRAAPPTLSFGVSHERIKQNYQHWREMSAHTQARSPPPPPPHTANCFTHHGHLHYRRQRPNDRNPRHVLEKNDIAAGLVTESLISNGFYFTVPSTKYTAVSTPMSVRPVFPENSCAETSPSVPLLLSPHSLAALESLRQRTNN